MASSGLTSENRPITKLKIENNIKINKYGIIQFKMANGVG